jgi:hypothetical protein
LKYLEALEHWSEPTEFLRIRDHLRLAQFNSNPVIRAQRLDELTAPLRACFFDRLLREEVLASALDFSMNLSASRIILPPITFALPGLAYDWGWDRFEAPGYVFVSVEFFSPDDPPILLRDQVARLLGRTTVHSLSSLQTATQTVSSAAFWHDDTYEHVRLEGSEFSLSKVQAGIVERLHKASGTSSPWVHLHELRDGIGFNTVTLSDLFKRQKNWRQLIASDGRGFYRLNL